MAIFLTASAVVVAVLVTVAVVVRMRSSRAASRPGGGRLAARVEAAAGDEPGYEDAYVDEQAAVWRGTEVPRVPTGPALFTEEVGQPDPRTPDAYDVSDLYATDELSAQEHAVRAHATHEHDAAEDPAAEAELGAALAAPVLDVWEEEDLARFSRARRTRRRADPARDDPFAAELRGLVPADEPAEGDGSAAEEGAAAAEGSAGDAAPTAGSAGGLARRTPKASEEAYRQPLRLARTQQRPAGGSRRTPEQVRAMLTNYRGGRRKGRSEAVEEPEG